LPKTIPRIERGAALLDDKVPGWQDKIDLATLDMSNCANCVVGQVYGDYDLGLAELDGEAQRQPSRYGFAALPTEMFDTLTDKWRAFLERRRNARRAA